MEATYILGIIGITITIAFGIWGIFVTIKNSKSGEITFFQEDIIPLFDSIVKNLSELVVSFKESPVKPNLFLIKGGFINSGRFDISQNMIEKELSINLPENFKWLTAKVVSSSQNVIAKTEINGDCSLIFKMGLFRVNEFIRFQALAEVPLESLDKFSTYLRKKHFFINSMNFHHRIKDVKNKIEEMPKKIRTKKDLMYSLITGGIITLFFLMFVWFAKNRKDAQYLIYQNNNDKTEVKMEKIESDVVYYTLIDSDEERELSTTAFLNRFSLTRASASENKDDRKIFVSIGLIFFYILYSFIKNYRYRKHIKFRKTVLLE